MLTGWVDANNTLGGLLGVRAVGGATIAAVTLFIGYTTPGSPSFINVDDISIGSSGTPSQ